MSLSLKEWGYQTCCPDEENVVGYYTIKDPEKVKVYKEPTYDSETYDKILLESYEQWKYKNASKCNLTLEKMNEKFGNIYTIKDYDIKLGKSNALWGWEKKNNNKEKTTWIRVDQYNSMWIPFEHYEHSSSDEDSSDEDSSDDADTLLEKLKKSNPSDEDENKEVYMIHCKKKTKICLK